MNNLRSYGTYRMSCIELFSVKKSLVKSFHGRRYLHVNGYQRGLRSQEGKSIQQVNIAFLEGHWDGVVTCFSDCLYKSPNITAPGFMGRRAFMDILYI